MNVQSIRCKGQKGYPLRWVDVDVLIQSAADKWRAGLDTADIAKLLGVHESEIWIRMDAIRRAARG